MSLTNYQKKKVARNLFLRGEEQQVIAEMLGLSENTISKWKQEGEWEQERERLMDSVNLSMIIVANLYQHAHDLSNKDSLNIDELNKYALAIERFTPAKDNFALLAELGKSLTLFLLEQQTPAKELNEFIETYKQFTKWYANRQL